jgi:hypothetical protein
MAESFIAVLNGVITGKHHGDISAELYGTPFYGHEKIKAPFDAEVIPMEPAAFYTPYLEAEIRLPPDRRGAAAYA